ncbi:type VI secretion system-associated FHA domain protein TagH [Sphingomonas sp. S-NIH.Pt1_0416]|uniref:type VI secretion system-associated FHA domain protein TagH n=1 Tax=Sphingomonas sp. S-NIH.Pt1_0416 TaxID=1920123 RepID=UPI001F49A21E|nr:type VI secretion system-associated FHA domain protein TagH [Sphingomonas sp. S-NIH.Pt1_0416]
MADGDRFHVGAFVIAARLTGRADGSQPAAAENAEPVWRGWDDAVPAPGIAPSQATPPPASDGWGPAPTPAGSSPGWDAVPTPPSTPSGSRWQPQIGPSLARPDDHRAAAGWDARPTPPAPPARGGWQPDAAAALPPVASTWEAATPPPPPASPWSSAAPSHPTPLSPDDLWGRIAEGNVVDWARGGFGQPSEPVRDPLGLAPASGAAALPPERPVPPQAPAAPSAGPDALTAFAQAAGLDPSRLGPDDAARAGALFRRLVAGLVVMVEARARAKAQLGAEATAFSPGGHNPLKYARTPDEAVAMLLGPAQPGFMDADQAIEDAFQDLQSHQVATLRAMQGALRTTLERFSPSAIRARAEAGGVIERILPAARDAALWQAYEREFGGVAQGSDEAFLDMFAKEFRQAYNEQSRRKTT